MTMRASCHRTSAARVRVPPKAELPSSFCITAAGDGVGSGGDRGGGGAEVGSVGGVDSVAAAGESGGALGGTAEPGVPGGSLGCGGGEGGGGDGGGNGGRGGGVGGVGGGSTHGWPYGMHVARHESATMPLGGLQLVIVQPN